MTVVNLLQGALAAKAAATPVHALTFAFERKKKGAEEDCRRQGITFLPMAAESLGGWHLVPEFKVGKVAASLSPHSGHEKGQALRHLWGRLGILLQRGNAVILSNQIPTHPGVNLNEAH